MRLVDLAAHRAILTWAASNRLIPWREYNALMRGVNEMAEYVAGCERRPGYARGKAQRVAAFFSSGGVAHTAYECRICGMHHIRSERDNMAELVIRTQGRLIRAAVEERRA